MYVITVDGAPVSEQPDVSNAERVKKKYQRRHPGSEVDYHIKGQAPVGEPETDVLVEGVEVVVDGVIEVLSELMAQANAAKESLQSLKKK